MLQAMSIIAMYIFQLYQLLSYLYLVYILSGLLIFCSRCISKLTVPLSLDFTSVVFTVVSVLDLLKFILLLLLHGYCKNVSFIM